MGIVKFGSARISENGTINGIKGDQKSGTEVSIQNYYMSDKGWIALRAISVKDALNLADAMKDACNNDPNIGYGQSDRTDLDKFVKSGVKLKDINIPSNVDCSRLIWACIYEAMGIDVGNFNTENEIKVISKSGKFLEPIEIKSENDCKIGDILVTKTKGHTVICVEGYGRNTNDTIVKPSEKTVKIEIDVPELKKGSRSKFVSIWQIIVGVEPDGEFGIKTDTATKDFQKKKGLVADGIVGSKTWKAGLES